MVNVENLYGYYIDMIYKCFFGCFFLDVDVEKFDEKFIMIYVVQFLKVYLEVGEDFVVSRLNFMFFNYKKDN